MVFMIILLIAGFVLLIKGADWFVDGASTIAKKLRVPSMIIGLTVVACGTSLPEMVVSLISSLSGANEMAISNVTGSNLFNLLLIIGICAIFHPAKLDRTTLKRDFPLSIITMIIIAFLACDKYIFHRDDNVLGHIDGIILLIIFVTYIIVMIRQAKAERKGHLDDAFDEELIELSGFSDNLKYLFGSKKKGDNTIFSTGFSILITIIGAACIAGGGELVVYSATNIAASLGISQTLIGLTIASIGTSLPELVTSIAATVKGEYDLALGNCIGSNIFNALFVLGVSSAVSPIGVNLTNLLDIGYLVAASIIFLIIGFITKKINRPTGIAMTAMYVAYFAYIIIR